MQTATGRDPDTLTCTILEDFLFPEECAALIARLEAAGIGATGALYPPSYRDNDRLVLDDEALAAALYARMEKYAPAVLRDGDTVWHRTRLNPRFRCCRYRDGQRFTIHRDGEYHAGPLERSRLTFMIYLNDGAEFRGGATRYYRDRSGDVLLRSVTPRRGACILFDHALWHDGEAVHQGTKYVLRSDVIYRAERAFARASYEEPARHLGYIWSAILLKDGRLASAGRDQTIRLFRVEDQPNDLRELQVLRGHEGSVACLAEARGALWSGDRKGHVVRWIYDGDSLRFDARFTAHQGAVLAIAAIHTSRFGDCVATSGADGRVHLFRESQDPILTLRGHAGWVWTIAVHPDQRDDFLYSGGEDGTVIRHALDGVTPARTVSFAVPVHSLLRTSDRLIVGLGDGRLVTCDPQTLAPIDECRAHRGSVRSLIALSDGRIASGGEDDAVAIFSADLKTELSRSFHTDFVRAIVELPGGAILSASYDGTLRRSDAITNRADALPPRSQTSRTETRDVPLSP